MKSQCRIGFAGVGFSCLAAVFLAGPVLAQVPDAATGAPLEIGSAKRAATSSIVISPPGPPSEGDTAEPVLVREINTPARQPFRAVAVTVHNTLNAQAFLTTVPEGKRLVVESVNWEAGNLAPTEVIFGGLRVAEFGPFVQYLKINPPHAAAASTFTLQDGIQQGPVYFEAGEDLWVSVSKSASDGTTVNVVVNGYFVDVP